MTGVDRDGLRAAADEPDFVHVLTTVAEPTDEIPPPWTPELQARLDEMQHVRDRGAAEGANYFIGGGRG